MMNGNTAKANPVRTIMGKAMYKPTSKAPVRSRDWGTIPPKDAARISSSEASQLFIFSSSDIFSAGSSEVSSVLSFRIMVEETLVVREEGVVKDSVPKERHAKRTKSSAVVVFENRIIFSESGSTICILCVVLLFCDYSIVSLAYSESQNESLIR